MPLRLPFVPLVRSLHDAAENMPHGVVPERRDDGCDQPYRTQEPHLADS